MRIRSHSRSEPSCPPQNAESRYGSGSRSAEWSATYVKEKSRRANAAQSTPAATAVETKRGEERVLRGAGEAAAPRARGETPADERVDDEPEHEDERRAAELSQDA